MPIAAVQHMAKLSANPKVTVYYNPHKPSESALDKASAGLIIFTTLTWLVTAGLWLTVFLVIRAHRRRKRAHEQWKAREENPHLG